MAEVTDQDVQESRDEVTALEKTLADLRQQLAVSEASRNNEVRKETLDRQSIDLRAQIAQLQRQVQISEGSADSLPITGEVSEIVSSPSPVSNVPTAPVQATESDNS